MARIPMVTRTIKSTKAKCLVALISDRTVAEEIFILPRTYKTDAEALKQAKAMYETDDMKVTTILETEVEEQLYGMTEAEFIKVAKPITKAEAEE